MPVASKALKRCPLIPRVPRVAPVPHRGVVAVSGSQASEFLDGIIASPIHGPPKPRYSVFLSAQGKVLFDVFLYTHTDPVDGKRLYLIDYDNRAQTPLTTILRRYVLRSKVKVRDVSEQYDVWATWGSEEDLSWETPRKWNVARSRVVEPNWGDAHQWPWGHEDLEVMDRRGVGMGKRMLVRKGDRPREASTRSVGSLEDYTLHRVLHGIPEGITDMPESGAFPMESNIDVMGGLDFRKGCYVGQELTVRTYHTGVLRKRIFPVVIHSPDEPPPEEIRPQPHAPNFAPDLKVTERTHPSADSNPPRPRGSGRLLTSVHGLGLALLRYDVPGQSQNLDRLFEFEDKEGGKQWAVTYWWPEWWPKEEDFAKESQLGHMLQ